MENQSMVNGNNSNGGNGKNKLPKKDPKALQQHQQQQRPNKRPCDLDIPQIQLIDPPPPTKVMVFKPTGLLNASMQANNQPSLQQQSQVCFMGDSAATSFNAN